MRKRIYDIGYEGTTKSGNNVKLAHRICNSKKCDKDWECK